MSTVTDKHVEAALATWTNSPPPETMATTMRRVLEQFAASAQGDWVMVPREPTQKMWNAGAAVLGIGGDTVERIYLAMIASAPAPGSWGTGPSPVYIDDEPPAPAQGEPVATVVWYDPRNDFTCLPLKARKIIDASMAFMDSAPLGTPLYAAPAPTSDDVKAERAIHCWFMEAPDGSNSAGPFDTEAQALSWAKMSAAHAPHYADWKPLPLYRARSEP